MKQKVRRNKKEELGFRRPQVSVTFDLPVRDKLDAQAKEDLRSVSSLVNAIVTHYYEVLNAPPLSD